MGLFAKKSLGQHFLRSPHVLTKIIEAAHISPGEPILEIGPGEGALTRALLDAGAHVVAVEKDVRAMDVLAQSYHAEIEQGRLRTIEADILEIPSDTLSQLLTNADAGTIASQDYSFALVANIPYYITGAILERFLEAGPRPSRMVLLVQREVAERIVARDGKESILSMSVKAFGVPRIAGIVPPGAFVPPPSVDSAILVIEDISDSSFKAKNVDPRTFFRIVKAAFAHKRKLARRNIQSIAPADAIQAAWSSAGIPEDARAEDVPITAWIQLASKLTLTPQ